MSKKAFLFDLDGTLIDSLSQHEEAFYQACFEYNCIITDELKEELNGKTSIDKMNVLVRKGIIDKISIPWIFERKNELATHLCFQDYKPLMQHIDAMNFIHREFNCKIVLCSNSPRTFVKKFVEKCGFEHTLSFSLSGEDVQFKKPFPDMYTKAFKLLSIAPEEAVIFEDSSEGKIAAIRAHCNDIIEVKSHMDISPRLIQDIVEKYGIRYCISKYMVHK